MAVAALIPPGAAAQDAAAEELRIQAPFCPCHGFAKDVAGSAATAERFLPPGVGARDREPSIYEVRSLQDADAFVYNGLGPGVYGDRLAQSGDLSHAALVKASDGPVPISAAGPNGMIRGAREGHGGGHHAAGDAAGDTPGDEDIRKMLEAYGPGGTAAAGAPYSIRDLVGGGHSGYGHDAEGVRGILGEVRDGDAGRVEGLEAIRDLAVSENRGHEGHKGHGGHDEHGHVAFDPHVWPDPALAVQQARNTRDGPAAADPDKAEPYQDNAAYAPRLDGPRDEYAAALPACRHDTTAALHATFAHMAERYGFDAVPLSGMTCAGTASTADMAHMVEYVQANDIGHLRGDGIIDTRAPGVIA